MSEARLGTPFIGAGVIGMATFLEAVRNRVLLVAVAFAVALIGLSVTAASLSFGERSRLIVDVGLAAASGVGGLVAIALMVTSFARELERHTAYPVLARPLPRWAFVLGKYLGVVATMVVVTGLMLLATVVTVWLFGDPVPSAVWTTFWLTWLEMAVTTALAMLFSTFATPVLASTYTIGLWLAGHLAGEILTLADKLARDGSPSASLVRGVYFVLPDLGAMSVRTQAANGLAVPAGFVGYATAYALAYAGVALLGAMLIFARRRAV
jgi:ABC-type transport system involved in multi-copper enzyme maturation permease subunit